MEKKLPLPPFTLESALQKVKMAEEAWNSKDSEKISQAYSIDSEWRNRDLFLKGRVEIKKFLTAKWAVELNYKLQKDLWCFNENRIAVKFEYEYQNPYGKWFRAYGNENWEFDENGLMCKRFASINDIQIDKSERKLM